MVVPLLIAAAAVSAAGAIAGAAQQAGAASSARASLAKVMKQQEKLYEIQYRARATQHRDLLFNQMNTLEQARLEKRAKLQQQDIMLNAANLQAIQNLAQISNQKFASQQQKQQALFALEAAKEGTSKEIQNAADQAAKQLSATIGEMAKASNAYRVGQAIGTESAFSMKQAINESVDSGLQEANIMANRTKDAIERAKEDTNKTVEVNKQLIELQDLYNQELFRTAELQNSAQQQYTQAYGNLNKDLIRAESDAFNLAAKANFLAQRININTNMRADKANLRATLAQIKAGMPSASIAPAVLGAVGNLAGSVATSGIFNTRSPALPSMATQASMGQIGSNMGAIAPVASLGNYMGSQMVPTNTTQFTSQVPASRISIFPSTITSMPPNTSSNINVMPPINWGMPLR